MNFLVQNNFSTLIFDCDGIILDSNKVKTEAFFKTTLPFGETAANALIEYHVTNGGVSRYKKFAYFIEQILPSCSPGIDCPDQSDLLNTYAAYVRQGLLNCQIAPGLEALRKRTSGIPWLVVSGGDQAELREVFAERGIAEWFDGGIFGSPDTKEQILQRELANDNIRRPALFLGDSKYDHQAATAAGLELIFLHGWTEVKDWQEWVKSEQIKHTESVASLLNLNPGSMI